MGLHRYAVAALFACCGTAALAEDWRLVTSSDSGVGYIDADSVSRDGTSVTFSGSVYYTAPTTDMFRSTTRYEGDCERLSVRPTRMTAYLTGGGVDSWDSTEPVRQARPGSNLHSFLRAACLRAWEGGTIADIDADAAARLRELRGK